MKIFSGSDDALLVQAKRQFKKETRISRLDLCSITFD